MFEAIVEKILNRILGQYVQNFSAENLKIGLWSGHIVLKNVKLKKQTIKKLNLPFKLKFSRLGCLTMNIPWSSLASSKIEVVVQGLQVVIAQIDPTLWQCKNSKIIEQRKQEIQDYCESVINDFAKKAQKQASKAEEQSGYFSTLVMKIIDNLQVTIKDIHIRYEDEITKQYSFGATLEQLKVFTVNQKDQPIYLDRTKKQYQNQPLRKKLILSNFGIYWNERSEFFEQQEVEKKLIQTIARKSNETLEMNYIILMSFQAKLLQRQNGKQFAQPQIDLYINFNQLKLQITNKQLQQIVTMAQRLQKFSNQVKRNNRVKLTKEQIQSNITLFNNLFPQYYSKKDQMNPTQLKAIQNMLQKMETESFTPIIKKFLQQKEKERIMKQKKEKSRGWFSGPKQLTQQEKQQIQKFLDANFGHQIKIITRPEDFYYIRVNFNLKVLQIAIANTKDNLKQGIRARFLDIQMKFNLRQNGYMLDFVMGDITIDLFKKAVGFEEEKIQFLKKLINEDDKITEYIKMKVLGNPLDRKYADTYINVITQQLLIMFHPKIIQIATQFASIKMNAQNTESAIQKYGELKQKTAKSVNTSLESTKKSLIYIDVNLKAISILLYFEPKNPEKCWVFSLGQTKVYTDIQTLKQTEIKPTDPSQKYSLQLNKISFKYFQNTQCFLENKTIPLKSEVLNNLNIDVTLQMYKVCTTQIPKIKVLAQMNQFQANLNAFTYEHLQKMGNCFADTESDKITLQKRSQQKSQVMQNAKKLGFLYLQEGISKSWKKYIAVLSTSYLYLYKDKKDINYAAYYYIKNSTMEIVQNSDPQGKQFVFQLKNKVNAAKFGFDKKNLMEDWIESIKKYNEQIDQFLPYLNLDKSQSEKLSKINQTQKENQTVAAKKQTSPDTLNFVVVARIKQISITTYTTEQINSGIVKISLSQLDMTLSLHEQKTKIGLSLRALSLTDSIRSYKMKHLQKFLYTTRESQHKKLIDIKIEQIKQSHPKYQNVDTQIFVQFGKLHCNYKPETVSSLMCFFIPPSSNQQQQPKKQELKHLQSSQHNIHQEVSAPFSIIASIFNKNIQKFSLKVHLKMSEISVGFVNSKTKILFGQISMQGFQMMFGTSNIRMVLTGGLAQLSYKDFSKYPHTTIQQQEDYSDFKYIMTSQRKKKVNQKNQNEIVHLMFFDINMLNRPNQQHKKMIILVQISDLQISYIQQPVLRIITYLNTQMLPSLSPDSKASSNAQQKKVVPVNDTKPQISPMDLSVTLTNINVLIQPRNGLDQYLKLNIKQITVKNSSLQRNFITQSEDKVLVQNYYIFLKDMSMFVSYLHPKTKNRSKYKLTPDIDLKLNCDLIANPMYYTKTYEGKFKDGMRIDCWMSDFFMRINHDDYNFLMKCLNWNVTFDDNAEEYLFDIPQQTAEQKTREIPPLYLNLKIQSVSLFIIEQQLPLAFMLLNQLQLKFTKSGLKGMLIDLKIQDMIGSNIIHKSDQTSIQRGLFNLLGYERVFKTQELRNQQNILKIFSRKGQMNDSKMKKMPVITFQMETDDQNNSFMDVKIEQLKISAEVRSLLMLSRLALTQQYIIPPPSSIISIKKIQPVIQQSMKKKENKPVSGKSQIYLQLRDFVCSVTDQQKQNFFIMQGQILGKLLNYPAHTEDEINKLSRRSQQQRFLQHSSYSFELKKFSLYFCNIKDMGNKRYILKPFSIIISMKKYYEKVRSQNGEVIVLFTDCEGEIEQLIFETSIRDLLNINAIIQDNLKNLNQYNQKNAKKQIKPAPKQGKQEKIVQKKLNQAQQVMERARTEIKKNILQKLKAKIMIRPLELLIINDCDNNFMPVLKFLMQQTTPLFESDIVKSHFNILLTISLNFFNARSSKFEPVIETYGLSFDYLNLIGQKRNQTKMILSNSQVPELKDLKLNISTQFISSLMTTLQKSKEEQKKLTYQEVRQQIQVSPFMFHNVTNQKILIRRRINNKQSDIVIEPAFKGTVRLTQDAEDLVFMIADKQFKISLQHYGVIRISQSLYYVEFKVEQLSRIIRFMSDSIIQNQLSHTLFVKRFCLGKQIDEKQIALGRKDMLALDKIDSIQFSLNQRSYTEMTDVALLKSMFTSTALRSQNQKFLLWVTKKELPNHFCVLQIWPPFSIINCLPKQFTIQFIVQSKTLSTKDILAQQAHEVNANQDFFKLKYKILIPGFYWSPEFKMIQNQISKQQKLTFRDRQNGETTINYIFNKNRNGYNLIIYCKAFMVSELQDDILAYGNLEKDERQKKVEKYYILGGQRAKDINHDDDIIIIGSEYGNSLRVCGDGCMVDFAQPFSLGGIGMTQNRRIVIKRQSNGKKADLFTTIGIDVSLKQMYKNLQIFSKKVTIHSRAIVLNSSKKKFVIKQEGSSQHVFIVEKGEKKNFYFSMPQNVKHNKGMIFKPEGCKQSIPVKVNGLGTMFFKCENQKNQLQYFKILIQQVQKYIFYELSQVTEQEIPYEVQNKMPKIKVYIPKFDKTLQYGEKISFINEYPQVDHTLVLQISHQNSGETKQIIAEPDNLNFKQKQSFHVQMNSMYGTVHVQAKIKFNDKKKFIIVDEVLLGYEQSQQEYEISSINLKLNKIVLSFIQNHISIAKPFESFCLFMQNIELFVSQTNKQSTYQIKLQYLQFDQQEPFNMPNPVIITPYRMKQFLRQQNPKSIFNAYIVIDKQFVQNTFISKIQIQFNDLVIKISQYFIDVILQMTKQFVQVINYKEEDYFVKREIEQWKKVEAPKEGRKTFIKQIAIAPFVLQISAQIKLDNLDSQSFLFFGTILNALGVVITNIEGAPISLDGIQLKDCVDTLAGINQKLINHYKTTVIKQLYKIFGSLNIIGNPIGLFRNISTGIKDLKDKPSQGFVKGPLQFGKGLAQGTTSLIAHSVGGALNSVSKVTGTISTGLAVLTFDKQFEAMRQKQKVNKPKHIFEGLQKGGKAVFYGFKEGITGVFLQPYENTKREGAIGFVKGTAKGLAGLIVKPVTGVIDFASKTAEGLTNTALYLQDKPNQNRLRYPRVFYTQCCTVKQYNDIDSKLNAIINKLKYDDEFTDSIFIDSFKCDDDRFLLMCQQNLMMIRLDDQKISYNIQMKDLKIVDNSQKKELIISTDIKSRFKKTQHFVKIRQDQVREQIVTLFQKIMREYQ